jgi:predicted PurR-regulated permease PerM
MKKFYKGYIDSKFDWIFFSVLTTAWSLYLWFSHKTMLDRIGSILTFLLFAFVIFPITYYYADYYAEKFVRFVIGKILNWSFGSSDEKVDDAKLP